jgi:N-dimethylarginine dimethylaminohydrolase
MDEVANLACNILSLGERSVVSTGSSPRIDEELRCRGYQVHAVLLDEFTQCGGGVHCLTMPLRRSASEHH